MAGDENVAAGGDPHPRFLCDQMLIRLAHWLRAAGYDTLVAHERARDRSLVARAMIDGRILLTRDSKLREIRDAGDCAVLLRGETMPDWVREITDRFALDWLARPFSRCLVCNTLLQHAPELARARLPDAVVFPESTEETAEIVKICRRHATPIVPFGTGTSLEGHVVALNGGISVDMTRMNRVLEVNAEDLDCTVEPGVTRKALNTYLRDTGLFFPIDPGADASIGGMTATRASGTNAVRYGTMRENVLGLTVVTADGRIVRTGGRARKSSAGYDLTRLFVGQEGTLGIITEIQLRLYGVPEAIAAAICQFGDLRSAVQTVILAMQHGIPVARIELLDDVQMEACIRYSKLEGFAAKPTLLFEFHGSAAGVAEQVAQMQAITSEFGGSAFE